MAFRIRSLRGRVLVMASLAAWPAEAGAEGRPLPRTPPEAARIADAMRVMPGQVNRFEAYAGGKGSLRGGFAPDQAFARSLAGMDAAGRMEFALGQALFEKLWVQAPSSTKASDGLGPLYNARSCAMCHPGNGRGHAPGTAGDLPVSLVLRLSVPGGDRQGIEDYLATLPDPDFGGQVQTDAVSGLSPEGQPRVSYRYSEVTLEGETVTLRAPVYDPGVVLGARTMVSPRLAPALLGMGLIAAIPEEDIRAGADPEDADGDGISGRLNLVPSRAAGGAALGRYGWKAGIADLSEQIADAFAHDLGISSPLYPDPWGDCTDAQTRCRAAPHGDGDARGTELDAAGLALTTAYVAGLAVPARDGVAEVIAGRDLFHEAGCAACHRPAYVTGRRDDDPLRSFQMIWPHSDFLLHDMGEGLADHRPEHRATGREWRTPPLWGIGRTKQVSGMEYFLHDGRARSLTEAILWHAGEARTARDRFAEMTKTDRDALIAYLESL